MPPLVKFLIGLAAALLAGWIGHGPLGQGAAFIDLIEAQSKAAIHDVEMDQVHVRFSRDPLRREAILSGRADRFQREGQGQFPGLNGRVGAVAGVSGVRWEGR